MIRFFLVACLLLSSSLNAQLEITTKRAVRTYSVQEVELKGLASSTQVRVKVTDSKRRPVPYSRIGNSKTRYEIRGSGKVWFEVTCIDFKTNMFDEKEIVIDLDAGNDVTPDNEEDVDDNPFDPPSPPGPKEYDGPNKYGLGKVSFDNAPRYSADIVKTYNDAAEFLFGRPSIKVMSIRKGDRRANTDYVLPVWIHLKMKPIYQSDERWKKWYEAVMSKLMKMEETTSTKDWYGAIKEIAIGLEARK